MRERSITLSFVAVIATALLASSVPAGAHSQSDSLTYSGGQRLIANVWIQTFSDWHGCGDWKTSAVYRGRKPKRPQWIKNVVSMHANGLGASISGIGISGSGTDLTASWTNTRAKMSDLSGRVCANWLTWYVSASSTAVAYVPKYGSPRIVTASV